MDKAYGNLIYKEFTINMKEPIRMIKSKAMVNLLGVMDLHIRGIILMTIVKVLAKCIKMESLFILGSGIKEFVLVVVLILGSNFNRNSKLYVN
jgi:hypothetical protein